MEEVREGLGDAQIKQLAQMRPLLEAVLGLLGQVTPTERQTWDRVCSIL